METRKGFLTPEQEKKVKDLIEIGGAYGFVIGAAIKLVDNLVLHKLKKRYLAEKPDALPVIYEFIDEVFASLND